MKFEQGKLVWLIIGFCLGGIVTIVGFSLANRVRPAPIVIVPPEPTPTPQPKPTPGLIEVFVNGHVARPAVYQLPPGYRVEDAVSAAGGFTADADTAVVNLALPLSDGAQVYVPGLADNVPPPISVSQPAAVPTVTETDSSSGGLININSANLEQLDTLPGIGPSTAQKILDHRDENGRFNAIEEIMNVSGIGEAKFDQIKDLIIVTEG